MKIVLASPHFPPHFIGGVEVYVQRLADGFLRLGHDPTVIAVEAIDGPSDAPRIDVDREFGYPVYRVSLEGGPVFYVLSATKQPDSVGARFQVRFEF